MIYVLYIYSYYLSVCLFIDHHISPHFLLYTPYAQHLHSAFIITQYTMAITHPYSTNIADSNSHPPSKSTPNHNPNNQITLLPVTKADLPRIALLEHLAFEEDEFSDLAFGKERGSPAALKMRERQFEKFLDRAETGEEGGWYCKAVLRAEGGGKEEIVGIAGWSLGGGEGVGKEMEMGGENADAVHSVGSLAGTGEERETKIKTKEELEEIWGKGSNVQLCADVFVRGDEHISRVCGVEKWLSMFIFFLSRLSSLLLFLSLHSPLFSH